jgi:hypothetical protein
MIMEAKDQDPDFDEDIWFLVAEIYSEVSKENTTKMLYDGIEHLINSLMDAQKAIDPARFYAELR